jgi:hypothetical protein
MKKYILLASILISGSIISPIQSQSYTKIENIKSYFKELPNLKEVIATIKVLLTSVVEFCPILEGLADIAGTEKAAQIKKTCLAAKRLNDLSIKSSASEKEN